MCPFSAHYHLGPTPNVMAPALRVRSAKHRVETLHCVQFAELEHPTNAGLKDLNAGMNSMSSKCSSETLLCMHPASLRQASAV